jgi:hypothetical protein
MTQHTRHGNKARATRRAEAEARNAKTPDEYRRIRREGPPDKRETINDTSKKVATSNPDPILDLPRQEAP